jgi:ribosomal protein L29
MTFMQKVTQLIKTGSDNRKDSKRSNLRKQLFNERQLNAMNRWHQTAVVAWK